MGTTAEEIFRRLTIGDAGCSRGWTTTCRAVAWAASTRGPRRSSTSPR